MTFNMNALQDRKFVEGRVSLVKLQNYSTVFAWKDYYQNGQGSTG